MKHVAISLLNFNGKKNTLDCLESLKNVSKDNFKLTIIVVDNGSTDGSPSVISNFQFPRPTSPPPAMQALRAGASELAGGRAISNFKIILNKENLGFSGGHNVTIRYALENGADYVLILNNDTYARKDFLTEFLKVAEKDSSIGILVPKIYFAPGFEYHKNRYSKNEIGKVLWYAGGEMDWANIIGHHRGVDEVDKSQFDKAEETEIATGCCMMINKEVFEKVGLLDDQYFLYYEDSDLSVRAKKAGFKIMYIPNSIIWHKNAGSVGGSGSALQDYYITRNRLIFGFRYAPIRTKLALFKESLSLFLRGRQWQKRGIRDFYLRKLGKGSYRA